MRPDLGNLIPKRDQCIPSGIFRVALIPAFAQHFVGRDSSGRACVLLGSTDAGRHAPVRLGGLDVQYGLSCAVRIGNGNDEPRVLTVLTCTDERVETERYFLHILSTLIEIVGEYPTLLDIAKAVAQLAGIFQRLQIPASENVAGIVGE